MYNIDFAKLIKQLLPSFLRSTKLQAWLQTLLHPLYLMYVEFLSWRSKIDFRLSITGQVRSLEYMLNKTYYSDGNVKLIHISDSGRIISSYLYKAVEGQPLYIQNRDEPSAGMPAQVYLFNRGEPRGYDFTVWVPSSLEFNINHMKGLLNRHKAAGFSYEIKTYILQNE
jgi:hypothetical protein